MPKRCVRGSRRAYTLSVSTTVHLSLRVGRPSVFFSFFGLRVSGFASHPLEGGLRLSFLPALVWKANGILLRSRAVVVIVFPPPKGFLVRSFERRELSRAVCGFFFSNERPFFTRSQLPLPHYPTAFSSRSLFCSELFLLDESQHDARHPFPSKAFFDPIRRCAVLFFVYLCSSC